MVSRITNTNSVVSFLKDLTKTNHMMYVWSFAIQHFQNIENTF